MDARIARDRGARNARSPRARPAGRRARAVVLLAAARTTPARACPKARARWPASAATTWRCGWTAATTTFTQMGGEGVPWVGQAPFTTDKHMFANLGDGTYFHSGLLAIRQSIAAGRQHHLQDPLQRRGRDDRRPAGRRRPEGIGAADHARARGRRRAQASSSSPTSRRSTTARDAGRPASRCTTATSSTRCSASCARSTGMHGHHLRPDLRHREAPPPQARHDGRPGQARGHQRAGVRRLRRLLGAEQLPVASSRWRPSSAASAASTRTPATRTTPA